MAVTPRYYVTVANKKPSLRSVASRMADIAAAADGFLQTTNLYCDNFYHPQILMNLLRGYAILILSAKNGPTGAYSQAVVVFSFVLNTIEG